MKFLKDVNFENGRYYLGASDIPTLALCNLKYGQSPLTLWQTLTGKREQWKGNESTEWGHELEGLILRKALLKLGINTNLADKFYLDKIKNKNKTSANGLCFYNNTEAICPHYNKLIAHADLVVENYRPNEEETFIIEAKSSKFFASKRNDDENEGYSNDDLTAHGIPLKVYLQVQTQLLCYDYEFAYVALLADTSKHKLYGRIRKDVKTQEHILAIAQNFWRCVENDTPPKPETWEDVIALNPNFDKESKTVISGDTEQKVLIMKDQYKRISKAEKKLDERKKDIKNAIGLLIGENAYLENAYGESLAKAYITERSTVELSRIKKELPDIYNFLDEKDFINKSSSRQIKF